MLFGSNFFEPFAHVHRAKRPLYILPQTVNRSHKIPNRPPLAKPYVNHQSEARKNTLLTRIGYGKFYATQITIRNDYATADDGPFPFSPGHRKGTGRWVEVFFPVLLLVLFCGGNVHDTRDTFRFTRCKYRDGDGPFKNAILGWFQPLHSSLGGLLRDRVGWHPHPTTDACFWSEQVLNGWF